MRVELDFGSEKRFFDFISELNDKDKIIIVSHNDLDGLVSARVINEVIKADIVKFLNYEDLNQNLVQYIKENKLNKIIFSDLFIGNEDFLREIEKVAKVLILDHHLSRKDWNSNNICFIKASDGYCAGYLCYYLFSKIQDIEKLDWLVACSCVSDYCHIKVWDWLSKLYEKNKDKLEREGNYVRKNGAVWDLQEALSLAIIYFKDKDKLNYVFENIGERSGSIGELGKYAQEVKEEVNRLISLYHKERKSFDGGYLYFFEPRFGCGSMISTILSGKENDKIIVTIRPDKHNNLCHVSIRRNDKRQDMVAFIKNLLKDIPDSDGGGHVPAVGGHFPKRYLGEVKKRLGVDKA